MAICEEGGTAMFREYGPWFYSGYAYPDSLGIDRSNWLAHGGTADVSPAAQIAVAERIQSNPPDQHGVCAPW